MRHSEAGFTLLEMVVTVAIAVILLAAGGVWMLSMRPGALRGALDDFDANLAAAKAIAATSGNGATLVFEPQSNGSPGYTLAVYSGRPTATGAVTATNTMIANSAATVSETHFGSPPFAIFLSSAGYPTGKAGYPTLSSGVPNFTTIASEPPCPSGGIELTFTSPQGVTATRTLPCNVVIAGTGGTDPTPSPNPMKVEPTYLLAHYTTDSGPLKFKAVEYGYYHWYDSIVGQSCQGGSSDTGTAPAVFASPWPYAQPSPSSQGGLAPAPPSAPYTWPVGDPNDPPALFQLSPVLHDGGTCTVTVADDNGQSGTVTVQVMGDLTAQTTPPPTMNVGQNVSITFSKTFDTEQLLLYPGGPCLGVLGATYQAGTTQTLVSRSQTTAGLNLHALAQGTCNLLVADQYGEQLAFNVSVVNPIPPPLSWPAYLQLGVNGGVQGTASGSVTAMRSGSGAFETALGPIINALLGGGIARAGTGGTCFALAKAGTDGSYDTTLPQWVSTGLNIGVDPASNCETYSNGNPLPVNSTGVAVYNANRENVTYQYSTPCQQFASTAWLTPPSNVADALLGAEGGSQPGSCSVTFLVVGAPSPPPVSADNGLAIINVQPSCSAPTACMAILRYDQYQANPLDASQNCQGAASVGVGIYDSQTGAEVTISQPYVAMFDSSGNALSWAPAPLASLESLAASYNGSAPANPNVNPPGATTALADFTSNYGPMQQAGIGAGCGGNSDSTVLYLQVYVEGQTSQTTTTSAIGPASADYQE
jgi:prepilin-type N-terminal cleavage/methylation domain-containing protein